MKIKLLSLILILLTTSLFSQNIDIVNEDEGVSKDSYSNKNENITIPLHTVTSDGISIPIFLSYSTSGMKINDIPSSVGFGWTLYAGGEITKTINHLVDENEKGWLFVEGDNQYVNSCGTDPQEPLSTGVLKDLFKNVDSEPDFFNVIISNGDYLNYIYSRRNYDKGVILNQNGNFYGNNIETDIDLLKQYDFKDNNQFYENNNDADIKITNKEGVTYSFRKGLSRIIPYAAKRDQRNRIDSTEVKNYYLHKVSASHSSSNIEFNYIDNRVNKYIRHTKAMRYQTNSELHTPPSYNDPINTRGYIDDVVIEDVSRREITQIKTPKERIEFIYHNKTYHPGSIEIPNVNGSFQFEHFVKSQSMKFLREIKIYDYKNNYRGGYYFVYTKSEQEDDKREGALKIKQILKKGINGSLYVFKEFDYFDTLTGNSPANTTSGYYSATSAAQDVFGYPNGETYNGQGSNLLTELQGNNRMPNVDELKKGMLKSIKNSDGGILEYNYTENSFGDMYFGGLLLNSIRAYNHKGELVERTQYEYFDPQGFGLPIYDPSPYIPPNIPNNVYEEGFFDHQTQMHHAWQTYFTRRDNNSLCQNKPYMSYYNISNIPFGLSKNIPTLYSYYQGMQIGNEPLINNGFYYSRIKEIKNNIHNNQNEKGYTLKFYRPTFFGKQLDKKLERIEYYNSKDIKIKEQIFDYDFVIKSETDAFNFKNNHNTNGYSYRVENFKIYELINVLRSVEENTFDNYTGAFLLNNKSNYSYLSYSDYYGDYVDYTSLKETTKSQNGEVYKKIENKYLREYQHIQNFPNLVNNVNPSIEKNIWRKMDAEWVLNSSTVTSLYDTYKPQEIRVILGNSSTNTYYKEGDFTSSHYDETSVELISADTDDIVSYSYNENQKIKAEIDEKNRITKVYQRSNEYGGFYVDAILTTREPYTYEDNFFLKKSFENPEEANVQKFNKAFSGDYVFDGSSINLGTFPNKYIVSFWAYKENQWYFHEFEHQGGNLTLVKPSDVNYLDEIIVKPKYSSIVSFTHRPLFARTSTLNEKGEGERIEYDVFGRPLFLFDRNKNVIKEFRYNSINLEILRD